MHEREMKFYSRITETLKRGVTSRDWSCDETEQKKSYEEMAGELITTKKSKYGNNKRNILVLLKSWKSIMKSNKQKIKWIWTVEQG